MVATLPRAIRSFSKGEFCEEPPFESLDSGNSCDLDPCLWERLSRTHLQGNRDHEPILSARDLIGLEPLW